MKKTRGRKSHATIPLKGLSSEMEGILLLKGIDRYPFKESSPGKTVNFIKKKSGGHLRNTFSLFGYCYPESENSFANISAKT